MPTHTHLKSAGMAPSNVKPARDFGALILPGGPRHAFELLGSEAKTSGALGNVDCDPEGANDSCAGDFEAGIVGAQPRRGPTSSFEAVDGAPGMVAKRNRTELMGHPCGTPEVASQT